MTAQMPKRVATSEHTVAPAATETRPSAARHDEPDDLGGRGWVIVAAAAAVVGLGALGAVVISATTDTADDPSQVRAATESADAVEANRVELIQDLAAGGSRSADAVEANRVELIRDLAAGGAESADAVEANRVELIEDLAAGGGRSADAVEANRVELIQDLAAGGSRSADAVEANRVELIQDLVGVSTGTVTVSDSSGSLEPQTTAEPGPANEGPNADLAPDVLAVPYAPAPPASNGPSAQPAPGGESNEGPNADLAPDPLKVPHILVNPLSDTLVDPTTTGVHAEQQAAEAERQAIIDRLSSL